MMRLLPGAVVGGVLFVSGFAAALLILVLATRLAPRKKEMPGGYPWTGDDGDVKRPIFLTHAHNY
jgi:hypothetical protein